MKNSKTGFFLIGASVLINLSACSYVKSFFPDKERDYQYTTELPPLILPNDLNKNQLPDMPATVSSPSTNTAADTSEPPAVINAPVEDTTVSTPPESDIPDAAITVERINFENGENRLRINVPYIRAWRMVNKALSRKSIEVTERDQESGLFTVQYAPDEQKIEDGSYWDEVVFLFKGVQSNEKTYLLKLEKNNQQTDIVVIDEDQQLLSDAASLKLLTLLQETIKTDLATQ